MKRWLGPLLATCTLSVAAAARAQPADAADAGAEPAPAAGSAPAQPADAADAGAEPGAAGAEAAEAEPASSGALAQEGEAADAKGATPPRPPPPPAPASPAPGAWSQPTAGWAQNAPESPPGTEPPAEPDANASLGGLWARVDVGLGHFNAWSSSSAREGQRDFSGFTSSYSIALAGQPKPGLVLGGRIAIDRVLGLSGTDENGREMDLADITFAMVSVGMLLQIYFPSDGGLHFDAGFDFVDLNVTRRDTSADPDDDPTGIGITGQLGYEWFVADELAAGLAARLSYCALSAEELPGVPVDVEVLIPAVVFTLTLR